MTHEHVWVYAASFVRLGFLGNTRHCHCGVRERCVLGGYPDERCNRIASRLDASLDRFGRRAA